MESDVDVSGYEQLNVPFYAHDQNLTPKQRFLEIFDFLMSFIRKFNIQP